MRACLLCVSAAEPDETAAHSTYGRIKSLRFSCSMSWPNRLLRYIELKPSLLLPLAVLTLCYALLLGGL
jgi:hypothetical protein